MNHKIPKLILTSLSFVALFGTFSIKEKNIEVLASDTDYKLVYNCRNDMTEAFAGVYDRNADSTYWSAEAFNIKEFFTSGIGVNLADENGILPSHSQFENKFLDPALSLKTYPLFTNSSMVDSGARYFNQYPQGWKMTTNADPSSVDAWPSGKCSANTSLLKFYLNGALHPGDGAAIALFFKAPYSGTISIKDTIGVSSSEGDGIYQCIYTVPFLETRNFMWNSQGTHALFGGYPIYPEVNTSPTSNWSTGWTHVSPATTKGVTINNFSISRGDYLVFIYASGAVNKNDKTTTNPVITYDETSIKNGLIEKKKDVAIVKVKEYVDLIDYRSAEQETITEIFNNAATQIEACTTEEEINDVVSNSRALLDQLKTDKQYTAEELSEYKQTAINEIESLADLSTYEEDEKVDIETAIETYKNKISKAETKEEVQEILNECKTYIEGLAKKNETKNTPTLTIISIIFAGASFLALLTVIVFYIRKEGKKNENN